MQIDKTKVKELFIAGSLNPAIAMLFRAKAGMPGLLIYLYVKWRLGFPHYMTKQKKNLDKIRQCINGKIRVRNGSKNQEQSTAKIGQRKINSTALARKFRQGSTSEVIN